MCVSLADFSGPVPTSTGPKHHNRNCDHVIERFSVSSFEFQVSSFKFSFKFQVFSFKFQVFSFKFQVVSFKFQVFRFRGRSRIGARLR